MPTRPSLSGRLAAPVPMGRQMLKTTVLILACCGIFFPALSTAGQTFGEPDLSATTPGNRTVSSLATEDDATLNLIVNGVAAGAPGSSDGWTYTHLHVSDSLKWGASVKADIKIGSSIIGSGPAAGKDTVFHLAVLTTGPDAAFLSPDGITPVSTSILDENITIRDVDHLLKAGSGYFSWIGQQLYFSGTLDKAVVDNLYTRDRSILANTLWSSSRAVTNFAGAAVSQLNTRKNGHNGVWASGLGDFSSATGNGYAKGYNYNGGGYAVGADHAFHPNFIAGLAFGQTFGTNEAKGDMYGSTRQTGTMGGLYARVLNEMDKENTLLIDSWVAYGNIDNKGRLQQTGDDFISSDKWMDNVITFGLKASWQIKADGASTLTPFVGIDYVHGMQNDIQMGGRRYYDGSVQNWTIPVGVTYKYTLALGGQQYLIPEITVSYEGDISRQNAAVATDIFGKRDKAEGVKPGRNAVTGNAGVTWIIDSNWNAGVYYNVEARSDMTNQGVMGTVRFAF